MQEGSRKREAGREEVGCRAQASRHKGLIKKQDGSRKKEAGRG
jgi:hypothetical protein